MCFSNEGYSHKTVNHSLWYKDPVTLVHTNSIEGIWAHVKRGFVPGGRRKGNMFGYLAKFILQRKLSSKDDSKSFAVFMAIANQCSASS